MPGAADAGDDRYQSAKAVAVDVWVSLFTVAIGVIVPTFLVILVLQLLGEE